MEIRRSFNDFTAFIMEIWRILNRFKAFMEIWKILNGFRIFNGNMEEF
jgi:hypothetical protein